MRDLLIALYSRPGLLPIAGMTLAGVVVIGWDLVRLAAGRWATTAATRRGRRPRAARTSRPTINLLLSILEGRGGFLALMAFLASDPDALPARGREPSPTGNLTGWRLRRAG